MSNFSRLTTDADGQVTVTDDAFSSSAGQVNQGKANQIDPEAAAESLKNTPLPAGDPDSGTMRITFGADGSVQEFSRVGLENSGNGPSVFSEYQSQIDGIYADIQRLEEEAASYVGEDGFVPGHLATKHQAARMQIENLKGQLQYQEAVGNNKLAEQQSKREAFMAELEADLEAQREAMREHAQAQRKRRYRR